jgi:hypothetical protein
MSWTLYIEIVSAFGSNPILVGPGTTAIANLSHPLSVHMWNVEIQFGMHPVHQFEVEVVLDSELDSKSNSTIPNWVGSPH